ncbi:hypothetical protein EDD16DRAFT_1593945 [Pisolithus croceorrhizus]|nr:hypothetical protein EDD16DRAFT_1593945 [Pisolithus croceorrhizus]
MLPSTDEVLVMWSVLSLFINAESECLVMSYPTFLASPALRHCGATPDSRNLISWFIAGPHLRNGIRFPCAVARWLAPPAAFLMSTLHS